MKTFIVALLFSLFAFVSAVPLETSAPTVEDYLEQYGDEYLDKPLPTDALNAGVAWRLTERARATATKSHMMPTPLSEQNEL